MAAPGRMPAEDPPHAPHPQIRVEGLSKRFRTRRGDVLALDDVSLEIRPAERVVMLGPSGCGKTTLLRCVAGLERPDAGTIAIEGRIVFSAEQDIFVPPEARGISMMFQSYALWPHMTVARNIAYPLENRKVPKAEIRRRVDDALEMVACGGLQARYPGQLSGGQQQRVALARAIVGDDRTVLFDEPLSNVDAKVREQLRIELVALQRRLGFASLYVTHDQTEATAVADRIAVFRAGRIAQLDTPRAIYTEPNSIYVAEFVGSSNELDGTVSERRGGRVSVRTALGLVEVAAGAAAAVGETVKLMFRPEQIVIRAGTAHDAPNSFSGVVEAGLFLGTGMEYAVLVDGQRLVVRGTALDAIAPGAAVTLHVPPEHMRLFRTTDGA